MLGLIIGVAMDAAGSSEDSARGRFSTCMRTSVEKALATKLDVASFAAFAKAACTAETANFRGDMIAYDIKAGWTRKKAEPDADGQLSDAVEDWVGRYRDMAGTATASK